MICGMPSKPSFRRISAPSRFTTRPFRAESASQSRTPAKVPGSVNAPDTWRVTSAPQTRSSKGWDRPVGTTDRSVEVAAFGMKIPGQRIVEVPAEDLEESRPEPRPRCMLPRIQAQRGGETRPVVCRDVVEFQQARANRPNSDRWSSFDPARRPRPGSTWNGPFSSQPDVTRSVNGARFQRRGASLEGAHGPPPAILSTKRYPPPRSNRSNLEVSVAVRRLTTSMSSAPGSASKEHSMVAGRSPVTSTRRMLRANTGSHGRAPRKASMHVSPSVALLAASGMSMTVALRPFGRLRSFASRGPVDHSTGRKPP